MQLFYSGRQIAYICKNDLLLVQIGYIYCISFTVLNISCCSSVLLQKTLNILVRNTYFIAHLFIRLKNKAVMYIFIVNLFLYHKMKCVIPVFSNRLFWKMEFARTFSLKYFKEECFTVAIYFSYSKTRTRTPKNRGIVSQQMWHDKNPSLLTGNGDVPIDVSEIFSSVLSRFIVYHSDKQPIPRQT